MSKRSKSEKAPWKRGGTMGDPKDTIKVLAAGLALLLVACAAWMMPAFEARAVSPDVVIRLREEPRMAERGRMAYLEKAYAVDAALKYWGANWSKITESAVDKCHVKLVLDPEALPTDNAVSLRAAVGERLRAAGCAFTRRPQDPETLETFRVPGVCAIGWVFWNAGTNPVTVERGGHALVVHPGHAGYLQIAADGRLEVREEF